MAKDSSFDIVAEVDLAEIQNAQNNALKLIANRYDFKGKTAKLEFDKAQKKVVAEGSDDYIIEQMFSIFCQQLAKRGVDLAAIEEKDKSPATSGGIRVTYEVRDTLNKDECKKITKAVKDAKMKKVKVSIQGESVRVASPSRDDLQAVQDLVRKLKLPCPISFTNYK